MKYLDNTGWTLSKVKNEVVDKNGSPIPWLTYPFIDFITSHISFEMNVFEYGSGNSTIWWSKNVKRVVSCEHEIKWYKHVKNKIQSNVDYFHIQLVYGSDYSKKIQQYQNEFDIIVVDGRDRVNCIKNCLNALNDEGVIIVDNSEREHYKEGFEFLYSNKFKRIDFWGIGALGYDKWCTTLFYREINCFGI